MVFTEADNGRLQNYKITKFTVFLRSGGASGVLNVTFEPKLNKCEKGERDGVQILSIL